MLPGKSDKEREEDFYVSSEEESLTGDVLRDSASHFIQEAYGLLKDALGDDRVSAAGRKFKAILMALVFLVSFSTFLNIFPKPANGTVSKIAETSGFIGGVGLFLVGMAIIGMLVYLGLQRMGGGSLENLLSSPELLDFLHGDGADENPIQRLMAYVASMILSVFGGFVDTVVSLVWPDDRKPANVIRYKRGGGPGRSFKQILRSMLTMIFLVILFALLIVVFMSVVLPALLK